MLTILGLADMRPNLMLAVLILVGGALVLRAAFRSRRDGGQTKSRWLPLTVLVAGPMLALALWVGMVVHAMYVTRGQVLIDDANAMLLPLICIGTFVGCVSALVFSFVDT